MTARPGGEARSVRPANKRPGGPPAAPTPIDPPGRNLTRRHLLVGPAAEDLSPGHTDALLVAAGAGNLKAFAEFYDCTAPVVWGMLRGVLGNHTQAERATEDIYLQLWHTAPDFDPVSRSAWETVLLAARRALVCRVRDLVVANPGWQDGRRSP